MELGTAFHAGRQLRRLARLIAAGWLLTLFPALPAHATQAEVQLLSSSGKPISGAVLMLRSTRADRAPPTPVRAVMDQLNRAFVPHVLVVPVGSSVTFPNSDTVSHQVYSFSPARRFQLPLYRGSPNPPVTFDKAGVVTLGCNIHDAMRAYVFIVDGQYYGRTDGAGLWNAAVDPGEYTAIVWHPLSREMQPFLETLVTVPAGDERVRLPLRAATPLKLRPESTVPPNWDAY